MKWISNIAIGVVAVSMLMIPIARAQSTPSRMAATSAQGIFCSRIDALVAQWSGKITDREVKLAQTRTERDAKLVSQRQDVSDKLLKARTVGDELRVEHFNKLAAIAKTDSQKQALNVFKNTVDTAVQTRQDAVDAAMQAFRAGVDQTLANRKFAIDVSLATHKSDMNTAVAKAKADCDQGAKQQTIRQQLRDAIKNAQNAFRSNVVKAEKTQDILQPLLITRRQAVQKAMDDFKTSMEQARQILKTALGQNAQSNPTP